MKPRERYGNWSQTFTGRQAWPMDPRVEDFDVRDIAHALALQCRFAGHCRVPYSVAEHSVRAARYVEGAFPRRYPHASAEHLRRVTLAALLHDATEAYLVDVPRPVKPHLHGYRDTEERLARVIELWAGLPHGATSWRLVREADELLLMTEKRDLMAEAPAPWTFAQGVPATPLPEAIQPWTWQVAEWEFRALFERLWKVDAPRPDHFHSCPYCYVKHPCGMACTIEGDLSDDGVDFGAHHACEACERAGADVDDATEAFQ